MMMEISEYIYEEYDIDNANEENVTYLDFRSHSGYYSGATIKTLLKLLFSVNYIFYIY